MAIPGFPSGSQFNNLNLLQQRQAQAREGATTQPNAFQLPQVQAPPTGLINPVAGASLPPSGRFAGVNGATIDSGAGATHLVPQLSSQLQMNLAAQSGLAGGRLNLIA